MASKLLFMLGLCRKAGSLVIGTDLVTKSLPSKKIKLVIYTSDASANTEKRITDKCKFYGVECIKAQNSSEEISSAIGKKSSVCVLGVTDINFSNELKALMFGGNEYGKN